MPEHDLQQLLDRTRECLERGDVFAPMEQLVCHLAEMRGRGGGSSWSRAAHRLYDGHPLKSLLMQDPATVHATTKPRGFPGDAEMLDYIYGCHELPPDLTPLGKEVNAWGFELPAERSVRTRRDLLARRVDSVAASTPHPAEVLSVACGHLREALRSAAVREGKLGRYVGLDQDPLALEVIRTELGDAGVQVVEDTVRNLAFGRLDLGRFDLIYSAGLYDYLSDAFAARLTAALFSMLKVGGHLLIANCAPSLRDIGYMEVVLDWHMIYREPAQVFAFCGSIPSEQIADRRSFRDPENNLIFLNVRRRC